MPILQRLAAALAWLGRRGTRALAVSMFLGLAMPQLAVHVKPHLGEVVFVMLTFSYLRTDPAAFRRQFMTPGLVVIAAAWIMIVLPLLFGLLYLICGLPALVPNLYTIMILQLVTTPITSSAAFAALLGLDVAFSLAVLIVSNALSPITTVAFAYVFLGAALFSPIELGVRLFLLFAGAGLAAYIIRRIAGQPRIERESAMLDGLNVVAVFFFAVAAMESIPRHVVADPLFALDLFGLIVVLSVAWVGLSVLVFWRAGLNRGLVIGLLTGFRNIAAMMAVVGASLPDIAWFYFALVQIPIFLFPWALQPLARRIGEKR